MSETIRLLYLSAATTPFEQAALEALLEKSRANNEQVGITGALLYHDGSFLQVLEGPEGAVRSLFRVISRDPRHHSVYVVEDRPIAAPLFGAWSMGWVAPAAFVAAGYSPTLLRSERTTAREIAVWLETFRRCVRV